MDFGQLVMGRRTVHKYLDEKVNEELIIEALRLSLWAPNHKLSFPWSYTVVGPVARAKLGELYCELKPGSSADSITTSSHYIALGLKLGDEKRRHEDYATLACSVQIMTMFLWENGVGAKWTTSGFTNHPRTYEILGLDSSSVRLEGGLMIGKPKFVPPAFERPKLEQFLRRVK